MTTYRCLHCGAVTGSAPEALDAMSDALANAAHGAGVCTPIVDNDVDRNPWCEVGLHWADGVTEGQMLHGAAGWACPACAGKVRE